jgi:hypothetical protein
VNPDLFGDYVIPGFELDGIFDVVVTSFAEGTDDKTELCRVALTRLGFHGPLARALLIDNRADLVDAWQAVGGAGYRFRSDSKFARDVSSGIPELAVRAN